MHEENLACSNVYKLIQVYHIPELKKLQPAKIEIPHLTEFFEDLKNHKTLPNPFNRRVIAVALIWYPKIYI